MSRVTYIADDTATLVGKGPVIVGSIALINTEPPSPVAVSFFNLDDAADAASATASFVVSLGAQAQNFSHTFDGVVFPKGLVVESDTTGVKIIVETL